MSMFDFTKNDLVYSEKKEQLITETGEVIATKSPEGTHYLLEAQVQLPAEELLSTEEVENILDGGGTKPKPTPTPTPTPTPPPQKKCITVKVKTPIGWEFEVVCEIIG
ncbi:hypothetical protein [Paenisporosarcina antarctica]|uniref:Uncharacterized protein n=1 Tax=Paenisporosarcina antarctica TaxID=417367 RepID=A0A4P7A2J6_9BACL|nr:hypothetical protein [Paenisporosarcina antarctica]QBP42659.1 hypothetical protein E2636_16565 [Paenisporosarcina antarctica]